MSGGGRGAAHLQVSGDREVAHRFGRGIAVARENGAHDVVELAGERGAEGESARRTCGAGTMTPSELGCILAALCGAGEEPWWW